MNIIQRTTLAILELRHRFQVLETNVGATGSIVKSIHSMLTAPRPQPREPTYVYLIPPEGPFYCQRAFVELKDSYPVCFESYCSHPAGVWVVACGPAIVRGVKLGNQMQSGMNDYQGQVCKTVDEWPVGMRLTVELAA